MSLAAPGALAHRLKRHTAFNTSLPTKSNIANPKWPPEDPKMADRV